MGTCYVCNSVGDGIGPCSGCQKPVCSQDALLTLHPKGRYCHECEKKGERRATETARQTTKVALSPMPAAPEPNGSRR